MAIFSPPTRWDPKEPSPSFPDLHARLLLCNSFKDLPSRIGMPTARNLPAKVTVGILGAGAAGLYAALLFDWLNSCFERQNKSFRFDYEILEADPERVGGRMYTYRFKSEKKYDYYDIGAMCFPDIPLMKRVFDLFKNIGLEDKTIPYVMALDHNLNVYNGKCHTNGEITDFFGTGTKGIIDTTSAMVTAQFEPFRLGLIRNLQTGWENLMKFDGYSTRGFMTLVKEIDETDEAGKTKKIAKKQYSHQLVSYLEAFESATSRYDQALTESVMDSLTFDYGPDVKWYCIDGGADQITTKMKEKMKGKLTMDARVTALAIQPEEHIVKVSVAGYEEPKQFDHVITTLPFGCLRNVDTSGCSFSWDLQTAIRSLGYDCSTKVAIQFSTRWWEKDRENLNQCGGVSSTDRPIRQVVYPSHGINKNEGATIIVSYTWSQDASRLGSLVRGHDTPEEKLLKDLVIGDLAVMHGLDKEYLSDMVVDWHAYDWTRAPNSAGAFALFGPSQFSTLFPLIVQPVKGMLHFAGEATSVHHAWLVGALNSALRSVIEILSSYKQDGEDWVEMRGEDWVEMRGEDWIKMLQDEFGVLQEIQGKEVAYLTRLSAQ